MINYDSEEYDFDESTRSEKHFSLRSIVARDWPYVLMLVLAIFGVAYTNFARQAMTGYWIILAPVFGLICVAARWRQHESSRSQVKLIVTQALHWTAVVFAMYLVFVADVKQMMSDFASSLMVLTVLALGTFTAGIHVGAWRICFDRNRFGSWRARHRMVRGKNAPDPAADLRVVRGHCGVLSCLITGGERRTRSNIDHFENSVLSQFLRGSWASLFAEMETGGGVFAASARFTRCWRIANRMVTPIAAASGTAIKSPTKPNK